MLHLTILHPVHFLNSLDPQLLSSPGFVIRSVAEVTDYAPQSPFATLAVIALPLHYPLLLPHSSLPNDSPGPIDLADLTHLCRLYTNQMCFIRIRPHYAPLTPPGAAPTLTKLHDKHIMGSTSTDSSGQAQPPMDTNNRTTERIRDSLDVTEFLEPCRSRSQEQVEQILAEKTKSSRQRVPEKPELGQKGGS